MKKLFILLIAIVANVGTIIAEIVYSGAYPENSKFEWTIDDNWVLTIYGAGEMPEYGEAGGPWIEYVHTDSIKEAIISEGITVNANYNFYYYHGLQTITLPSTLTKFGYGSFSDCSSLRSIRFAGAVPPEYMGGNYGIEVAAIRLTVPVGASGAYKNAWLDKSEIFDPEIIEENISICAVQTALPDTTVCSGEWVSLTDKKEYAYQQRDEFEESEWDPYWNKQEVLNYFSQYPFEQVGEQYWPTFDSKKYEQETGTSYTNDIWKEFKSWYDSHFHWYKGMPTCPKGCRCEESYVDGKRFYESGSLYLRLKANNDCDSIISRKVNVEKIVTPYYIVIPEKDSINSGVIKLFDTYQYGSTEVNQAQYDYFTVNGVRYNHKSTISDVYNVWDSSDTIAPSFQLDHLAGGSYMFRFYNDFGCDSLSLYISVETQGLCVNGIYYKLFQTTPASGERETFAYVTYKGDSHDEFDEYAGTVVIPEKITLRGEQYPVSWIGEYAFANCQRLDSVVIPNSIKEIYHNAFDNSSISSVYLHKDIQLGSSIFKNCKNLVKANLPEMRDSAYVYNDGTKENVYKVTYNIPSYCFYGCTALKSITIPNNYSLVGSYAFYNCSSFTTINLNQVTVVDNDAFEDCSSLTSIIGLNKCTTIGNSAFKGCSNLRSVNLDAITSLRTKAFQNCVRLENVILGDNLNKIESYLFDGDSALTAINIPEHAKSIGSYAFQNCVSLQNVEFNDSVGNIGSYAFKGCQSLQSVVLPICDSIINTYAFQYCTKLKYVYMPPTMKSIDRYTFTQCNSNMKVFLYAETPPTLNDYHYKGYLYDTDYWTFDKNYTTIYVPQGSLSNYTNDKYWSYYTIQEMAGINMPSIKSLVVGVTTADILFAPNPYNKGVSIVSCNLEGDDTYFGNGEIHLTGLEPNQDLTLNFTINYSDYSQGTITVAFRTKELQIKTLPSKAVASNIAILLAETNLEEKETSCGFEYKRNDAPADMDGTKVYCPVASGQMAGRLKNLKDDVYYKYRAFYQSAAGKMYYGDWQYIFTGDVAVEFDPILYTYGATLIRDNEATISGYALAGSEDFTEQGFEYWAESRVYGQGNKVQGTKDAPFRMPAALGEHIFVPASGISLRVTLTNLDPGTVYKYRVYGKVGDQMYYGAEQTFTTTGTYTPPTYIITFLNWDGTELQKSPVEENTMPVYNGEMPVRPETSSYRYTFKGWTPELVVATEDATYTATYTATAKQQDTVYYTITFINWDETVLQKLQVEEGEKPVYTGETPTRPEDENYTYTFAKWSPKIVEAYKDATYMATFTAEEKSQDFDNVQGDKVPCTKVLRDGQIYIIRGEKVYTVMGQSVK